MQHKGKRPEPGGLQGVSCRLVSRVHCKHRATHAYYLDLFSPSTYSALLRSDRSVSGFRVRQRNAAARVKPGSKLLCYLTVLSRWCGILEVLDGPFEDPAPLFTEDNDPFVVRFHVRPIFLLTPDKALPIHLPEIWQQLSFTKSWDPSTSTWTGKLRASLTAIDEADGQFLARLITEQARELRDYPLDEDEVRKLTPSTVRRSDRVVMSLSLMRRRTTRQVQRQQTRSASR